MFTASFLLISCHVILRWCQTKTEQYLLCLEASKSKNDSKNPSIELKVIPGISIPVSMCHKTMCDFSYRIIALVWYAMIYDSWYMLCYVILSYMKQWYAIWYDMTWYDIDMILIYDRIRHNTIWHNKWDDMICDIWYNTIRYDVMWYEIWYDIMMRCDMIRYDMTWYMLWWGW